MKLFHSSLNGMCAILTHVQARVNQTTLSGEYSVI